MPRPLPSHLIETAILLLGAPRSGTTWLAKIFDSHPDVLYRHEPDELHPAPATDTAAVRTAVAAWINERRPRSSSKRPFFRKSWQNKGQYALRYMLSTMIAAVERVPRLGSTILSVPLPDLGAIERSRAAVKSVAACNFAGAFARALPGSRTILILRHPCGQVSSMMRGNEQGRFVLREAGTELPIDEARARAFAATCGVDGAAFRALPDAAKYAWAWRAFNETAFAALQSQPNARVILYEALCAAPEAETRALFAFAGLEWAPKTAAFLAHSTQHGGATGYYDVLRISTAAAEAWRARMPRADQQAVSAVAAASPLAPLWPD